MKTKEQGANNLNVNNTNKNLPVLITEAVFLIFFALSLSFYMGWILSVGISAFAYLIFFAVFRKSTFRLKKDYKLWINCVLISASMGYFVLAFFDWQIKDALGFQRVFLFFSAACALFIPFYHLAEYLKEKRKDKDLSIYLYVSLTLLILYFVIIIDFPVEAFINNASEFSFTLKDELISQLNFAPYVFLLCFLISLFPQKVADVLLGASASISVCVYVQYMFFNKYIGRIFGGSYDWKSHLVFSLLSLFAWALIIMAAIIVRIIFRQKGKMYLLAASGVVFALLLVSFFATIVKAPQNAFRYEAYYVNGKEQFTIGKKNNVIIFVIDSADNQFIREIMNSYPETFEAYKDFTLYTDTCSVYDLTSLSVPQMLLGYTHHEDVYVKGEPFLKRFKDNGYRILFYNVYACMVKEYVDNYEPIPVNDDLIYVDHKKIGNDITRLALFQALPCVLKGVVEIENINFDNYVFFNEGNNELAGNEDYETVIENRTFESRLKLTFNEYSDNCFYYYHIEGAHFPCDNPVEESRYCLNVFGEFIRQMKEMGVYEDATIIVCADHGFHDDDGNIPFPTASTPMCMIKKRGEEHEKIQLSNAPVYFADFQSTVLMAAGLFEPETDYDLFGKSFYDYQEGDIRTRTWFDTNFHSEKTLKISYTGGEEELVRAVEDGKYEEVDSLEFEYNE